MDTKLTITINKNKQYDAMVEFELVSGPTFSYMGLENLFLFFFIFLVFSFFLPPLRARLSGLTHAMPNAFC